MPSQAAAPEEPDEGGSDFRIGFLVHDVSRLRQILFDQAMRPHGATRAQWWVLAQLSRRPEGGMTQAELARLLGLGKVATGSMIDRLEASGFVRRRDDALDRRIYRIVMTAKGRAMLARMVDIGRRLNGLILDGVAAEDMAAADRVLTRIKRNIRLHLGDGETAEAPGLFDE
jgi:DNA-binding MarR family transcriptional regulator